MHGATASNWQETVKGFWLTANKIENMKFEPAGVNTKCWILFWTVLYRQYTFSAVNMFHEFNTSTGVSPPMI